MRKRIAWLLVLSILCSVLLCGCDNDSELGRLVNMLTGQNAGQIKFSGMQYVHPDMDAFSGTLEESCRLAKESRDISAVEDGIWAVYDAYDDFYTNLNLADIHYSADLTDTYWKQEYNYCTSVSSEVDASLESLYQALAQSPIRDTLEGEDYFGEGFFDSYEGDGFWDETLSDYMNRQAELVSQYYDLAGQALEVEEGSEAYYTQYGTQMAQLYVDLVALRQELADYLGYESYPQFAYDYYYYRDYTPEQAEAYTQRIRETMVPLYRQINGSGFWDRDWGYYTSDQTFSYVQDCAKEMGVDIWDAFRLLKRRELYDLDMADNKYDSSFEVYLTTYQVPYIFTNPQGTAYDPLTFAHEFGHFCNDYVSGGSAAGTDVAEVFSQGMEYLSLCYGQPDEQVRRLKMMDCLNVYVEQAAYASFEQQVYGLTGEDLTVENVQALYGRIGREFGFDSWNWDERDFVTLTHYYTNPMYIISYVVSNDAAFQFYQMEQQEAGSGLSHFRQNLNTEEQYFLSFLQQAGLTTPFDEDRPAAVAALLETELTK